MKFDPISKTSFTSMELYRSEDVASIYQIEFITKGRLEMTMTTGKKNGKSNETIQ